jgi:transposase-like protein
MNRLENLNKKFKKDIKNSLENGERYPKVLKEGLQKLMVTNHKNDKKGFSPKEIADETGMNPDLLYRWRYQALDPNGQKYSNDSKVVKSLKRAKKAILKPSKKVTTSKPSKEVDSFKDAIFKKIHHSDIISQLNGILDESVHNFEELEEFEITEIKKIIEWASILLEKIEDFSHETIDMNDFIFGSNKRKEK